MGISTSPQFKAHNSARRSLVSTIRSTRALSLGVDRRRLSGAPLLRIGQGGASWRYGNKSGQDQSNDPAWCSIHQCEMKRWEKDGRIWFSQKVDDDWCKGKLEATRSNKKRILKVEEVGDFWREQTIPRICLKGKWLAKAGILPNLHVEVESTYPGMLILYQIKKGE